MSLNSSAEQAVTDRMLASADRRARCLCRIVGELISLQQFNCTRARYSSCIGHIGGDTPANGERKCFAWNLKRLERA